MIFPVTPDPTHRPVRVYLETSALNYMHSLAPDIGDAIATKAVQNLKGTIFYASPVLIWEILLIGDEILREHLLQYCAHLCDEMLPKSPGELILDNILAKGKHVTYDNFSTKSPLADLWQNITKQFNQTIGFDKQNLKDLSDNIKNKSKRLDKIIDDFIFTGKFQGADESLNVLISIIYSKIEYPNKHVPEDHIAARKIAILVIFLIVCEGAELAGEYVSEYWKRIGIDHPFDRLLYLAVNYPIAFYTGPATFMAAVISYQKHYGKTNRGAIHDGLHLGYLPYFDVLLSNDELLAQMQLEARPIYYDQYSKVYYISKMDMTIRRVRVDKPHPLL